MSRIGIIDYGAGNLHSVAGALKQLGVSFVVSGDREELDSADALILPGVGAFPAAMEKLGSLGLVDFIRASAERKPLLGICLGMQLLLSMSHEFSDTEGLGLLPGEVARLSAADCDSRFKIPHMGWDLISPDMSDPLMKGLGSSAYVYFVHSFKAVPDDESDISAFCRYGEPIASVIHRGNVWGTQFHPEKSGERGMKILKNFCSMV